MVFYRKYRPWKFAEIIGQEHIVKVLTNALATNAFSHGYLFAGPRGLGKTSLARIFAKALNCSGRTLGKDSFEPCNRCGPCKEITAGKSLDLIEIDAASNRGIDEIRALREKIRFAPNTCKFKIYIIDEVHMLTKEAFNALLKTLEEPPAHAIFLMATTEPQKVLPTILSRVQRFDLHRAQVPELKKLLKKVTTAEKIKITDEALGLLAQLAFGSYRDGLSLFDQIASQRKTAASNIDVATIQEVLGLAQDKSVFDFILFLAEKNRQKSFDLIQGLHLQGIDLENFCVKVVEILRKMALWKLGEDQLFDLTKEQQAEAQKLAEAFEVETLFTMIERFVEVLGQIKSAPLPCLPLEMAVYELTMQSANCKVQNADEKSLTDDKEVIEEKGAGAQSPEKSQFSPDLWINIVKEARTHNHSLAALLKDAVLAGSQDETITLAFKFKFHATMVSNKKNTQIIEQIIEKITGSRYKVCCIVNPELVIKAPIDTEEELLNGAKEVFEVE